MSYHRRYKLKDDRFGLLALALREKTGLTQAEVAKKLSVSERTIRHWEAGTAYPSTANLKELIELYWYHHAFTSGREREEIEAFWRQATTSAARSILLDEGWLEELLQRPGVPLRSETRSIRSPSLLQRADWGEAMDVTAFYGREQELSILKQWIEERERCRVIVLVGMGGIGKTTLSIRFAQEVLPHFGFVLWRSLRNLPPLEELLNTCIQILSGQEAPVVPQKREKMLALLLEVLQKRRCLLILDNAESLLQPGHLQTDYRKRYEGYAQFFEQVATAMHQSCLLLTSREMFESLEPLEGSNTPVRILKLSGLAEDASQDLLAGKNLFGTSYAWQQLISSYSGNPLALKIVGATVRDLFGGDIAAFLREGLVVPHTLWQLLEQQFTRLAPLEREIMYWLAIERNPVPLASLRANLSSMLASSEVLSALQALRRRCLVERGEKGAIFLLQPEVMAYVSEQLVQQISDEILHLRPRLLITHALLQAQSSDVLRESQRQMLVYPILKRLSLHLGSAQYVEQQVFSLLDTFRRKPVALQGYGSGNLINLLVQLKGHIRGADFSALAIRQAYLHGVEAQDASFKGATFFKTVFTEPIESIASLALSSDGVYLAVGSFSGHIRIWHMLTKKVVQTIRGHQRMVWALAFSPDSALLASAGYDRTVKLWQVADEHEVAEHCVGTLSGHERWIRALAFSPDGALLASAGDDECIRLWNVQEQRCLHVLAERRGTIWSLSFHPDGSRLFTGARESSIGVWDVQQGKCLQILHGHQSMVMAVACHPQGRYVASGDESGLIYFWDTHTYQLLTTLRLHTSKAASLAFNQEGTLLASGSQDGSVEIWDLAIPDAPARLRTLPGHPLWVSAVAFGQDNFLASISYGGKVQLWNGESGTSLGTFQGYSQVICALSFSPNGRLLLTGDDQGVLRIWDVQNKQCLRAFQGHVGRIWSVTFSPDGKTLASGGDDQIVKIWSAEQPQNEEKVYPLREFHGYTTLAWSVAFSPDGQFLASGGFEQTVKLWRTKREEGTASLTLLEGHAAFVWSIVFSPDGNLLASGDNHGTIKLWHVANGQCVQTLYHGQSPISALRFSHDSLTLFSSDVTESIIGWNIAQEEPKRILTVPDNQGDVNWTRAFAFNGDGTLLAVGGDEHTIKIWRVDQKGGAYRQQRFSYHAGQVWSVAFSPDNRWLASGDDDGTLLLWELETGACVHAFRNDRPYERMSIQGVKGLSLAQRSSLKTLGAIDRE